MAEKIKILVADDEEIWRNQIKEILEKVGYDVISAGSGDRAIELIESNDFQVIILDMRMESEFRGIEVLEYVKKNSIVAPIIILTSVGNINTATDAMKKGAFDFLDKNDKSTTSNKEIRKKVEDALHHLFYKSLKQEIISILESSPKINRYNLLEKIVERGRQKTEFFDIVLNDMNKNREIIEDMDIIKYQIKHI